MWMMKSVIEVRLVKVEYDGEFSEWLPVERHVDSLMSFLYICTNVCTATFIHSINCSKLWFPAGDIHSPDKGNRPVHP